MDTKETKDEIARLYKLYYERDKAFESAKMKRTLLTVAGFSLAIFILLCYLWSPSGWKILETLIYSVVFAGIHCFINGCIFASLAHKGHEESEALKYIKNRIQELEKKI